MSAWRSGDPQQALSPRELETLETKTRVIRLVPWGRIRQWEKRGRFEVIAQAFHAADDPSRVSLYGQQLAFREEHQAFDEYLARYHPKLSTSFRTGTGHIVTERDQMREQHSASPEEQIDIFLRGSDRPQTVRRAAFRSSLSNYETVDSSQRMREVLEALARRGGGNDMSFVAGVLLSRRSRAPWIDALLSDVITKKGPGWKPIVFAARREESAQTLAWLLELREETNHADVHAVIDNVALRLGRALQLKR